MSRKKKSRKQDRTLEAIVLLTAIIELIGAILELIEHHSG